MTVTDDTPTEQRTLAADILTHLDAVTDDTDQADIEPAGPTMQELLTEHFLLSSVAAKFTARSKKAKAAADQLAAAAWYENGAKSWEVSCNGEPVGTFTTPVSDPKVDVGDSKAFAAWVEENFPTEIDYVPVVKEAFQKKLIAALEVDYKELTVTHRFIDKANGTFKDVTVPGLVAIPKSAGTPKLHTTQAKRDAALERILNKPGNLAALVDGRTIPGEVIPDSDPA